MLRTAAVAALVSTLAFTSLFAESRQTSAQDDETLEWLDDYDEALALAKRTGKPLFLEFRCAP